MGTAGDKHNIAFAMRHLQMDPLPHAMVGGDEGLPGKPEPAIFLEAARRIGADPAACIVFEDAPFGIEAARRAGMQAVAVCTSHSAEQLTGDHVIAQIKQLRRTHRQPISGDTSCPHLVTTKDRRSASSAPTTARPRSGSTPST